MRILSLILLSSQLIFAERDRTSCFNYIDCLEQAQLQFKTCSGGTAIALSLERRTRLMSQMLEDKRNILENCAGSLKKESLDFDTLQTLVNEDSRECFQKIPFSSSPSIPENCDYPLSSLPSKEIPHGGCLNNFQRDRHRCERLLACCPEHNACAERMNALSIAYQLARKKSREISDKMMECISDETAKENEDKAEEIMKTVEEIKGEEEDIRDSNGERGKKEAFPTLSPTTVSSPVQVIPAEMKKRYWIPNKIARLHKSVVGELPMEEEEEIEEVTESTLISTTAKAIHISDSILPSTDGGMPFKRPDKEMRQRIQRRLQLTPSVLLEKNREDFFEKFDKMRKEKEDEAAEKEIIEDEEEEVTGDRKVAIVKFLLEKADTEMTEKVITMLASGDIHGLMEMEKAEKKKRKKAILKALPSIDSSSNEELDDKAKKRVSIESVIKQTLEKVSSDHRAQKNALMKNIKSALAEQRVSMEKLVAKETARIESPTVELTEAPATTSTTTSTTTTELPSTTTSKIESPEESLLDKKEAKLSAELKQRLGLENEFKRIRGEEVIETTAATVVIAESEESIAESHKKLDIRPVIDSESQTTATTTTVRPVLDSDSIIEPSTTLRPVVDSDGINNSTETRKSRRGHKKRGKGSRHTRKSKVQKLKPNPNEPTEGFCTSYGQCEALVWDYELRCDKKFNPITVTFGIDDSQLRHLLLNNSKSESSVVTQVCLRPVDKSVHNSVLQLQHIERGVRKACLSLGRDRPTLEKKEIDECKILSHFSVIEMEDWLETTHGHTEANLAECQARTAGIAAGCQELANCCSAVNACEEYIAGSPVRKMRAEAIQLLLAQQDDCENRMEKTLRQLHSHFRLKPVRR